ACDRKRERANDRRKNRLQRPQSLLVDRSYAVTAARRNKATPHLGLSGGCHRIDELPRSEPDGVVRRQTCLRLGSGHRRASLVLCEGSRVERDGGDLRGPRRQREPLVELDELAQGRDRVRPAPGALDLRLPGLVAEDEQVRGAAV